MADLTVLEPPTNIDTNNRRGATNFSITNSTAKDRFANFFKTFRLGNNVYIYRDALIRHWNRREMFIEVDLAHVNEYDEVLFNNLQVILF